jgi:hypothetical protein
MTIQYSMVHFLLNLNVQFHRDTSNEILYRKLYTLNYDDHTNHHKKSNETRWVSFVCIN